MATKILPLATSGACDCCPRWLIDCCPYRKCGVSSRLLATTSDGFVLPMLGSRGVWAGQGFWDAPTLRPFAMGLVCDNGSWSMIVDAGLGGIAEQPLGGVDCLGASFLFDGFALTRNSMVGDLVITITEDVNKCSDCCCWNNKRIWFTGLIAIDAGACYSCRGFDVSEFADREPELVSVQFPNQPPLCIYQADLPLTRDFDDGQCFCPDSGGNEEILGSLWYEVEGGRCKAVIGLRISRVCGEVGPSNVTLAIYQKILPACPDTSYGIHTFDLVSSNEIYCSMPPTISVLTIAQ